MDFITPEELEKFTDKITTEEDAAEVKRFCDAAMEAVRDYLGYDPTAQDYSQLIKGNDSHLAIMKAMPINTIDAFFIDGAEASADALEVQSDNYICFIDNSIFLTGHRYVIEFNAGFTNVPDIIKTTALQIASLLWESAGGNLAVNSTSFADTGSRVFNNFKIDRFLTQIAKYKRTF